MHPPFGLPLERVLPAGGASFCGQHFREGTVVGMNAWVTNRHKGTFGEDAESWRPGRWLCDEGRRREMENAILTVSGFSSPLVSFDPANPHPILLVWRWPKGMSWKAHRPSRNL